MASALPLTVIFVQLSIITFEDFRYRAVTWWFFPLLFCSLSWLALRLVTWEEWFFHVFSNLLFLFFQLIVLTGYLSFKRKTLVNILNGWLGLGDILFVICAAAIFSLPSFILFHIASLLLSIVIAILLPSIRVRGIPLAGIQSFFLATTLATFHFLEWNSFDNNLFLLLF